MRRGAAVVVQTQVLNRQIVVRDVVVGVDGQHGCIGRHRPGAIRRAEVARDRQVALDLGQAVTVLVRLPKRRLTRAAHHAEVAEHDAELAPRHRETRIERDRLLEQGAAPLEVAIVLHGARGLRVLAERLQRSRRHLLERGRLPHGSHRLAGPRPHLLREPVDRRDDLPIVARRFAKGGEHASGVRGHQPRREHVARAHGRHASVHHDLDPFALGDLPRQRQIEPWRVGALHAGEHGAHGARRDHREAPRLRQVRAKRLRHDRA